MLPAIVMLSTLLVIPQRLLIINGLKSKVSALIKEIKYSWVWWYTPCTRRQVHCCAKHYKVHWYMHVYCHILHMLHIKYILRIIMIYYICCSENRRWMWNRRLASGWFKNRRGCPSQGGSLVPSWPRFWSNNSQWRLCWHSHKHLETRKGSTILNTPTGWWRKSQPWLPCI